MERTKRIPVLLILLVAAPALAAPPTSPADLAARFGAREGVEQISLSPDGRRIAWIEPFTGQGAIVYTMGFAEGEAPRAAFRIGGNPERLQRCNWVSNERLVCTVFGVVRGPDELYVFSRIVAMDADGSNPQMLSRRESADARGLNLYGGAVIDWLPDEDGAVLMTRNYLPDDRIGTRLGSAREGLGVDRVDTRTLRTSRVEAPRPDAYDYISDGRGRVRIMGLMSRTPAGYDRGVIHYSFRRKGSAQWEILGSFDVKSEQGFLPEAIDADLDLAYGWRRHEGRWALFSKALDGSGTEALVLAHPQVDVDELIRIGRRGRVVGASYATDIRHPEYFDPATARLLAALARALPGQKLRVVDASVDESRLLLWAGSDEDPGVHYLFDASSRELRTSLVVRPQLEGMRLGRMQPVTYPAADGTQVPGYLTLPPGATSPAGLPGLVLPHGGPSARDEWGFDWLSQFFAQRGFAVLQPNFRGSAGYGDAWLQQNGFRSWRIAVGDVIDAGRWLVREGADPARLAILGWSYGGYAALMAAAVEPALFKGVVAIAPVTDLALLKEEWRGFTRFRLVRDFIGSGPHIREGSPVEQAARIEAPVLLFHGGLDRNVGIGQSRRMATRLQAAGRQVRLVTWDELDHYLTDSAARSQLLAESDQFLAEAFARR